MLSRTARRLETTLLVSRQSLPRPARLRSPRSYSTPSKPARAPATATATLPAHEYPGFVPSIGSPPMSQPPLDSLMSFMQRRPEFTILPTPLPKEDHLHDTVFTDTITQDKLAVMDACLNNLYNVPRARSMFNRVRNEKQCVLNIDIYNRVLYAYFDMALKDESARSKWLNEGWLLFKQMKNPKEGILPDGRTYALLFAAWHRFSPNSPLRIEQTQYPKDVGYSALLDHVTSDPNVSILDVVAHPVIPQEAAADLMKLLPRIALEKGDVMTVNILAKAKAIASGEQNELPEALAVVKQIKTEGGNVASTEVPFNIQNLRDHLTYVAYAKKVLPDDMVARQRHLELSAYDMAEDQLKDQTEKLTEIGIDGRFHDKVLQDYMYTWYSRLTTRLTKEIKLIEEEEAAGEYRNTTTEMSPYLSLVSAPRLAIITILEVMRLTGTGGIANGMKTTRAMVSVGQAVEVEYKARFCRMNDIAVPAASRSQGDMFSEFGYSNLYQRRVAAARQMGMGESWTAPWSQQTRAQIGGVLLECLMEVAEIVQTAVDKKTGATLYDTQPAFYHAYEFIRGNKLGCIKTNSAVTSRIAKDPLQGMIHPRYLPMLIPPKPWLGAKEGAYLFSQASMMRFKDSVEQEKYVVEAVRNGRVELVMEGLNVLGHTPWKINKKVFEVVLEVWNTGKRVGKIPPAVFEEPAPTPPCDDADLTAKATYGQKLKAYEQSAANSHSDRCSVNYKIEIARVFADETIYFPHNLDFRGRAYPVPPHLNHIGDDLSRGLLRFAQGKPLGTRGFRWLKIHLANLHGYDKADFDARVEWVNERLEEVKDSARDPLGGSRWWMEADDPWQCLAVCHELSAALESPDPLEFVSYLPVHQDGTCNGLQHYAAMGGDSTGAAQVNLVPVEKPSDVYTFVKEKVEKLVNADADAGDELAKILQGKITRKVVKQTVMTTVYGVTFIGARDQLHKQLQDRGDIPSDVCWKASAYLARQVLTCIGDTFTGAKTIQNWLNLCARVISKSISPARFQRGLQKEKEKKPNVRAKKGEAKAKAVAPTNKFQKEQMTSVIWTTALGLPIVQPYRKQLRKQLATGLQSVLITDPNSPSEVNTMKQATAFPPNFVHSLDATHMLLTAIESSKRGLSFAAVHDSYWTHACDIDTMSTIIRDTFIDLHSSDMLQKLNGEFRIRYKGHRIPIVHLQNNQTLGKKLVDAGVKVKIPAKQAHLYAHLSNLIEVTEDEAQSSAVIEDDSVLPTAADLAQDLLTSLNAEGEEGARAREDAGEWDKKSKKDTEKAKADKLKAEEERVAHLMNKFVDLVDVLPPLPEKGSFDVNDIRKSLYFFS